MLSATLLFALLAPSQTRPMPNGYVAVRFSEEVDSRLGGFPLPGSRIDVLQERKDLDSGGTEVVTIAEDLLILEMDIRSNPWRYVVAVKCDSANEFARKAASGKLVILLRPIP